MTVAYDAVSFNTGTFTADISWTHTPAGTPKGVLVLVFDFGFAAGDVITGITYGGVAMTQLALSPALFGMGAEADSRIFGYFLGAAIPTGAQTVAIDVGPGGFDAGAKAAAITVTAAANTTIEDTSTNESTTGTTTPSVTMTVANESLCFAAIIDGTDVTTNITADAGNTNVGTIDLSSECGAWTRANAVSSTDKTISWTTTSEEYGAFGVAVKEVAAVGAASQTSRSPIAVQRAAFR